jgi:hypothetical protein
LQAVVAQVAWGLSYIAERYGSPMAAWAHETQVGWYAKGGTIAAGNFGFAGEQGIELIQGPAQVYSHDQTMRMLGGRGDTYVINLSGVFADQQSKQRLVRDLVTEISRIRSNGGGLAALA